MRDDLLALGSEELVALSNRGLWKRANKELEKGNFEFSLDPDQTIHLKQGEASVLIAPDDSLSECFCSCGAQGVCRHKILAVLAYQAQSRDERSTPLAQEWSPGDFEDEALKATVGAHLWRRAVALKKSGLRIRLQRGEKPRAFLPTCTVTYLVPHQLDYARCDCAQTGPCEHLVLACWAFRLEGDEVSFQTSAHDSLDYDFREVDTILQDLLLHGVRSSNAQNVEALKIESRRLAEDGLLWLSQLLQEISETVSAYQSRSADFSPQQLAHLLLDWWVRTRAQGPRSRLWGLGVSPLTPLKQVTLTSLGVRLEHLGPQTQAHLYLADPKAGVVMVIHRSWEGRLNSSELASKRFADRHTLESLVTSRIVTEAAKRMANRELILGVGRVGRSQPLQDAGNWGDRFQEPLLVRDFQKLHQELSELEPAFFRPRLRAESVRILEVQGVSEAVYRPGSQSLTAELFDGRGASVLLHHTHRATEPGSLAKCFELLGPQLRYVSGRLRIRHGKLVVEPLNLVTDSSHSLALAPSDSDFQPKQLLAEESLDDLAVQTWEHSLTALQSGLKMVGPRWSQRGRELAPKLRASGLTQLAQRLETSCQRATPESWFHTALRAWLLTEEIPEADSH